jgi:antibiotic biosynthesis monooxygenase (ABM) superfamily enzyme
MIRVIIGYKTKKNADIQPILIKLRAHAMTYPGFIGDENLQNVKDSGIVAMIQTWDRMEDWLAWEPSIIRKAILDEAKPILQEDLRVTIYRVIPTSGWGYTPRES